jgi:hypothetical protein
MYEPEDQLGAAAEVMLAELSLDDEGRPLGCISLLMGALGILQCQPPQPTAFIKAMSTQHGDLASAWMRFICTYRTLEQLDQLNSYMIKCRCAHGPLAAHNALEWLHLEDITNEDDMPPVKNLVQSMCAHMILKLGCKPSLSKVYRARKLGHRWPYRMQDIVPFDRTKS